APGVRNGCPRVSAVWGADDRAGDDRRPGGDPPDPDAFRILPGGRGSVAGRAGVAVGGEPLGIEARRTPTRAAQPRPSARSVSSSRGPAAAAVATPRVVTLRLGHYTPRAARGGGGGVRVRTF